MINWITTHQWQVNAIASYLAITFVIIFNSYMGKFFRWFFNLFKKKKDDLPKTKSNTQVDESSRAKTFSSRKPRKEIHSSLPENSFHNASRLNYPFKN